jgi:hypothetical protein
MTNQIKKGPKLPAKQLAILGKRIYLFVLL